MRWLPLALACLFSSVALARAQDAAPAPATSASPAVDAPITGFQLGARAGYGRALSADSPQSLTYQTPALLPLVFDAGYRTSTRVYLGLTGQLALASRSDCGGAVGTCSAKDYRVGGTFQYHFSPLRTFDPWFGLGLGFEVLHLSGFAGDPSGHRTRTGFVVFDAQLGGDIAIGQGPRPPKVGPFVGLAVGTLGSDSGVAYGKTITRSPSGDHEWVTVGVRGTMDL